MSRVNTRESRGDGGSRLWVTIACVAGVLGMLMSLRPMVEQNASAAWDVARHGEARGLLAHGFDWAGEQLEAMHASHRDSAPSLRSVALDGLAAAMVSTLKSVEEMVAGEPQPELQRCFIGRATTADGERHTIIRCHGDDKRPGKSVQIL